MRYSVPDFEQEDEEFHDTAVKALHKEMFPSVEAVEAGLVRQGDRTDKRSAQNISQMLRDESYDVVTNQPYYRELLRLVKAPVLGWHRMAICCAGAGEASLYAAPAIFPYLAGREIRLDARKTLGMRCFSSNLPTDFGLRAVMDYLPESTAALAQARSETPSAPAMRAQWAQQ